MRSLPQFPGRQTGLEESLFTVARCVSNIWLLILAHWIFFFAIPGMTKYDAENTMAYRRPYLLLYGLCINPALSENAT